MSNGENGNVDSGGPEDDNLNFVSPSPTPDNLFNGQWHTFRYHVRIGTTDFNELWIDGVYPGTGSGNTSATNPKGATLGRNLNQGPGW